MRVIGTIPHPEMKITVFETDTRYPVQFEAGGVQLTYRFRKGGALESLADVKKLVDEELQKRSRALLQQQNRLIGAALHRHAAGHGGLNVDDLPEIV